MTSQRPSFDEFKSDLERLLGQALSAQSVAVAQDFWGNLDIFENLIASQSLAVHVDTLRLSMILPQYGRYHAWKGGGIVLTIIGIVLVWLLWQLGAALILFGAGTYLYGKYIRFNDAKEFGENLMKEATLRPYKGGFSSLCSHYLVGTIRLVSPKGSACWPQHPSNAITGERSFVQT